VHDVVGNSCLVTNVVTGDRLNGLAEELRTNSIWSTQVPVAALMSRPRFGHDGLTHPCEPASLRPTDSAGGEHPPISRRLGVPTRYRAAMSSVTPTGKRSRTSILARQ
jgi:hypothetical protein